MIVDHLRNARIYKTILPGISAGLDFLINANPSIAPGTYEIIAGVKAIVSEYTTKAQFEWGFEAHQRVIDIQYPITGIERVKWSPLQGMQVNVPYDPLQDVGYFTEPTQDTYVDIGNGIFSIMFPNDAHGPQHFVNVPMAIKKITIKISC